MGENLVKNGDLSLKNNTNFPDFTYGESSNGSYLSYNDERKYFVYNDYVYVDTSKRYEMYANFKSN